MKRILLLTAFYRPFIGGAERFAEELALRCPHDYAITICTARLRRSLPKNEIVGGVIVRRVGFGFSFDKFLFPFLSAAHGIAGRYYMVHAVMASYAGAGALFIKTIRGTPYILTLQSGTLDTPRYVAIIRLIFPLYRAIHTHARAVHAVSNFLGSRAQNIGVPQRRISVIPNGINGALFLPLKNIPRNPLRIVIVARLEPVKGLIYAIGAMDEIHAVFPEAELIIAGNGSFRAVLEKERLLRMHPEKIVFLGEVSPYDIPSLLSGAGIFVCPSLAEGFGIGVLEAMAAGTPVVASRVGGIPDILRDGEDGILVSAGDPSAIASAVMSIMRDDTLRVRFSAAGRMRAQMFDWNSIIPSICALWK
jgi:glycosyltransferase involved in cell wall biosynthesis